MVANIFIELGFTWFISGITLVLSFLINRSSLQKSKLAKESYNWTSTEGEVESHYVEDVKSGSDDGTYHKAFAMIRYFVDENSYIIEIVRKYSASSFGKRHRSRENAFMKIQSMFPKGMEIRIFYNPLAPSQSVFKRGVFYRDLYLFTLFSLLLLISGIASLFDGTSILFKEIMLIDPFQLLIYLSVTTVLYIIGIIAGGLYIKNIIQMLQVIKIKFQKRNEDIDFPRTKEYLKEAEMDQEELIITTELKTLQNSPFMGRIVRLLRQLEERRRLSSETVELLNRTFKYHQDSEIRTIVNRLLQKDIR